MEQKDIKHGNNLSSSDLKRFLTGKVPFDVNDRFCKNVESKLGKDPSVYAFKTWLGKQHGSDVDMVKKFLS